MVARTAEESRLSAALDRARSGDPQVVVIEGELGSGKTWMLQRLVERAGDALVVQHESTGSDDHPLTCIDGLLDGLGSRRRIGARADSPTAASALLAALATAAADSLVVVAVDDAHEIDELSADALWRTLRQLQHGRVLVAVASRPEGRLRGMLTRGTSSERARMLRLGGLTPSAVARLAAERGVPDLRAAHVERLAELTDGNPLHVLTAVDELGERLRTHVPQALPVPSDFAEQLQARLDAASPQGRALLRIAAVVGEPVSLPTVLAIARQRRLHISFDDAARTGLVEVVNAAGQRELNVVSARAREAIRASIPDRDRRSLHAAAAAQFSGPSRHRHLLAATEFADDAVAAELETAAADAVTAGRYADGSRLAAQAAGVSSGAERRGELLLTAGELAIVADEESLALALAPAVERLPASPRRDLALAGLDFIVGDFAAARRRLHAIGPASSDAAPVRPVVEGGLAWAEGDPERVLTAAARPAEAVTDEPLLRAAAAAHERRRRLLVAGARWMGGVADPAEALDELLHPGDGSGVTQSQAEARIMLGQVALYSGRHREALAVLEQAVAESRASGSVPALQLALAVLALAAYVTGDWTQAGQHADEILALSLASGDSTSDGMAHAVIAMMSAQRGDLQGATRSIRAARTAQRRRPVPQTTGIVMMASALVERGRNDPEAVLMALDAFEDSAAGYAVDATGAIGWRVLRAEALVRLDRVDEAESLLSRLPPGTAPLFGHPDWVRGISHEQHGDLDAAIEAYRRAAEASEPAETPWARALALTALGAALGRAGAGAEATVVLRLARAAAVRLGLEEHAASAPRDTPSAPRPEWSALTPREREIVALAAEGRLNREIAAALHISVKTVEFHLARALGKLGLSSRRQLR